MVRCAYCKKSKQDGENFSLHKFPSDEKLRRRWIQNMGRTNWVPKKIDALCSRHFDKECINFRDYRVRLRKGSVPIHFGADEENLGVPEQHAEVHHVEKKRKLDNYENASAMESSGLVQRESSFNPLNSVKTSVCGILNTTSDDQPAATITRATSSTTTSSPRRSTAGSMTKSPIEVIQQSLLGLNNDHSYAISLESTVRKLDLANDRIASLVRERKNKNQQQARQEKKINKLKQITDEMRDSFRKLQEGSYTLEGFGAIAVQLFSRMRKNIVAAGLSKDKYPPQLRCFALTLHFHSPAAYKYIRKSLEYSLPHPTVIRKWYSTIDAEPGFSEECFNTLKLKREEYRKINKTLICSLMLDGMGIKKGCQRTPDGIVRGHVDIGTGGDGQTEAKEALVLMLVSLNDAWKLPIAFFLIDGMSAEAKARLITDALVRLHEVGVIVSSLTLDGPADHLSAIKKLGANMTMDENSRPYFPHPVENQQDVHVILDPCHDLKNIRNALAEMSVILDGSGRRIEWKYIKLLAMLQQEEGLRLGNKLRTIHIDYKKMIMKVFLAAQTLSSSVADAIEFCWSVLGLPEFEGCDATVEFIRNVDCLFDFLNVRNPWGKGFKSPLRAANEHFWRPRVLTAIKYLSQLQRTDGRPIHSCPRKTGFIGFYTAVLSVFAIFDRYVKPTDASLNYLLTYKLSQDHLELLFAAIRARSGWCPNPTASQFISAYKRLLVRHDVNVSTGNIQIMDKTKILNVSSQSKAKLTKVARYDTQIFDNIENERVQSKYGMNESSISPCRNNIDDLHEYLNFAWAAPETLTEFSGNVVGYIAGFIVRKLSKTIKCQECVQGCKSLSPPGVENSLNSRNEIAFVLAKTRGGLIIASDSVIEICKIAERLFRKASNCNLGKPPTERNFPAVLANKAFHEVLLSKKSTFPELEQHFRDTFVLENCMDHMCTLTKHILMHYIEVRMNALTKNYALCVTGTNIRHFLTRQIVWAHQ